MTMSLNRLMAIALLAVVPATSFALPIDWHGAFGVDSTLISGYRRVKATTNQTSTEPGSQEVGLDAGGKDSANWLSYVFKLAPTMIINDAATFKAELTTGYANGGFLGDSSQTDANNTNRIPLYYHNQAAGSSVNIKKAYVELYSDTATYLIGRHTYQWGMGAIYNDGSNTWDRHASSRDGITMKLKVGNFHVHPFWSKVANTGFTTATDVKEYGIGLLYDNAERDIAFGIMYGIKSSNGSNTTITTTIDPTNTPTAPYQPVGETDVKVTDIYLKKTWDKFDIAIEVPLISGDLGKIVTGGPLVSYSTKAILAQTNYKANDSWTLGLDGGHVNGHDGSASKFGALYLNPNYQVANLLYRYNIGAIGSNGINGSVYDSYITNSMYLKLRSSYSTDKWVFDTAIIYAKALEVATVGKAAYNHTKNKLFIAKATQSDDLGTEIDMNATYKWNNEISIGAGLGYLITGDYFGYTDTPGVTNEAKSSLLLQLNTSVTF